MTSIEHQIEYATQEMAMLNKLLAARAEYRRLDDDRGRHKAGTDRHIANIKACDALANVMRIEREYNDMFGVGHE